MIVGFVVDAVSEVLRIQSSTVEPPPAVVAGVESEYIKGVGKLDDRLLILLDLDKLVSMGKSPCVFDFKCDFEIVACKWQKSTQFASKVTIDQI